MKKNVAFSYRAYIYKNVPCGNNSKSVTKGIRLAVIIDLGNDRFLVIPITSLYNKDGIRKKVCEFEKKIVPNSKNKLNKPSKILFNNAHIILKSALLKANAEKISSLNIINDLFNHLDRLYLPHDGSVKNEKNYIKIKMGFIYPDVDQKHYYLIVSPDKTNMNTKNLRVSVIEVEFTKNKTFKMKNGIEAVDKSKISLDYIKRLTKGQLLNIKKYLFKNFSTEIEFSYVTNIIDEQW